ncbi:MAG: hypothetical protein WCP70_08265 [Methanothrix sp.]
MTNLYLYPGKPYEYEPGKFRLDDNVAMDESMALAIEEEMKYVFEKVKASPFSDMGKEDRSLLFMAISRGVLRYLRDNQNLIKITFNFKDPITNQVTEISANVNLNIDMDKSE